MTSTENGKWWFRGLCFASVFLVAGCMGGGSGGSDVEEGPEQIIDPGDEEENPVVPDEEEDPIDIIADIVTDVVTTSVSVTTITSTGGS